MVQGVVNTPHHPPSLGHSHADAQKGGETATHVRGILTCGRRQVAGEGEVAAAVAAERLTAYPMSAFVLGEPTAVSVVRLLVYLYVQHTTNPESGR